MPSCYPPLTIDPDSIDFNVTESGFTSAYVVPDPSCEPAECALPPLIDTDLIVSGTLTTPQGGCKYTFESIFPSPPVYIPKPIIPVPPCPQGVIIESAITFTGTNSAKVTGGISVIGGPCNFLIGGIVNVDVPPVTCLSGSSFSSSVTSNPGASSLSIIGGPCNFALVGNIGGSGAGPGSFLSCPISPTLTVTDLFTTDMSGNPILNFPRVCSDCDVSNAGPFTMVDPTFGDINIKTATTASCCGVSNDSILDLCGGVLTLSDSGGNVNQMTANSITITGTSATVLIDSTATAGNSVAFQLVATCVSGTPMSMYILASAPF